MAILPTVVVEIGEASGYAAVVLVDTPDGYWRLDELTGTVSTDLSGNARHGTYVGSPSLGALGLLAIENGAVRFDGTDDYVTMGDIAAFEYTGAFSVECWVKFTSTALMVLVSKADASNRGWLVYANTGLLHFASATAAAATLWNLATASTYNDGLEHHVVCTWDGTTNANGVKIYVDGAVVAQATANAGTPGTGTVSCLIGTYNDATTNRLTGTADEVALYTGTLSSTRVSAHYASGRWTSITTDVLREQSITSRHGIDSSSPTDRVASTGMAVFAVDNSQVNSASTIGYYSPHHASKRAGWGLGTECRIRLQDPTTLTWHTRFRGHLDAIDPQPGVKLSRMVWVTVVDWLDEAARRTLQPEIGEQVGVTWDTVLTAILDQMPIPPFSRSLDVGHQAFPYALDTSAIGRQTVLAEFKKQADSEFGLVYSRADSTLRGEGRHTRLLNTTSVWTLQDVDLQELELPSTREDIINTAQVTTHPKVVDTLPNHIVYEQAGAIEIAAGATQFLLGPYRNDETGEPCGATDIQTQVSGTDFIGNTQRDGTGSDLSPNFTVTVTAGASGARFSVTNNAAVRGYLVRNVLWGKRILDHGTQTHTATDAPSITAHAGEHVVNFDMPYQANQDVGIGAAEYILAKFKDPLAQAKRIRVVGDTPALVTHILTRDISDRITVVETVTGVNNDFFINACEVTILPSGHVQGAYVLTPAQDPFAGLYWVLNVSTLGTDTVPAPF